MPKTKTTTKTTVKTAHKASAKSTSKKRGILYKVGLSAAALVVLAVGFMIFPRASEVVASPVGYPASSDKVSTQYGDIGKWMLMGNGQVSNYGGQPYKGKTLLETINLVVVDKNSKSTSESIKKLNDAMNKAGFPIQLLHSSGFKGLINGKNYDQQPSWWFTAYADKWAFSENNHGRMFGPAPANGGGYVYSASFSTEVPTIYNWLPAHAYTGSNVARDTLTTKLVGTGQTHGVNIDMQNTYNTSTVTTGDHDGMATVVLLK